MSGPKTRCPSCGSEWDGPVVFCGECGTPVTAAQAGGRPGAPADVSQGGQDRAARLPPQGGGVSKFGAAGSRPPQAPTLPSVKSPFEAPGTKSRPAADLSLDPRAERPSDELNRRRTVMGMPAVVPAAPAAPAPAEQKSTRQTGSFKRSSRRSSVGANEELVPRSEAKPPPAPPAPEVKAERRKSEPPRARSAPPPARRSQPPAPEVAEEQKLLEDLDAGFESIVRPSAPVVWIGVPSEPGATPPPDARPGTFDPPAAEEPPPTISVAEVEVASTDKPPIADAQHESDMAQVRALFADIAVQHARPLRDFMIEVTWGEPTKEWLDVAIPATSSMRRASEAMEMPDLGAALDGFAAALELASGEASINGEVREMLQGAYRKLVELLPNAFALDGERGRREPIIIRGLLLQVPGVFKVTIDKLYAAGLNALDVYWSAKPRDLAETTGIDLSLAEGILDRFARYRREIAELSPGKDRAKERAELSALLDDLRRLHEEHERAASGWSADAAQRRARARKDRADAALKIDVLLAHMGEVELPRELEKSPFAKKIELLDRHLQKMNEKAKSR